MKIRIRDVVSGGLQVKAAVKPADIGLENEDFLDPENPLQIVAELMRVDGFILAKVAVTFIREDHCARCLEHLSREMTSNYEMEFEVRPGDEWIDMGQRVREEMLMGYLPRVLCRDDCKGICPDCGAELNTETCECEAPRNVEPSPASQDQSYRKKEKSKQE